MKALAGLGLVAVHALAFGALAGRCHGAELAVEIEAANAVDVLALEGTVPAALAARITTDLDDGTAPGPGLHRKRWVVRYRGGIERSVGAAQLVGPFQDPAARTCTGRVVVAQRLLDDGRASPGTVAGEMQKALETELRGLEVFPAGTVQGVKALSLRWARLEWHPDDRALVGDAPHGYVRAALTIVLDRVDVPVVVALVPAPATTELGFRITSRAALAFDNRLAQWVSDKLGGSALATRLARQQIDRLLITTLAPPPPFALAGGQQLRFGFCAEPAEILEGTSGALPFAVELGRVERDPTVRPPRRGRAPRLALAPGAALGLDLDLDALNALLYELWRGGFLDRALAGAGLDARFNADPIVSQYLSLRISPPRLALPPVLSPSPRGLRLAAEARIAIADGAAASTVGRVWGGLDLQFGAGLEQVTVDLGALELSCERTATTLVPCYADLVAAIRARSAELPRHADHHVHHPAVRAVRGPPPRRLGPARRARDPRGRAADHERGRRREPQRLAPPRSRCDAGPIAIGVLHSIREPR